MQKCTQCSKGFPITEMDKGFYKKLKVPKPTFCARCRQQRRTAWRNDKHFYKNICFLCGKKAVSMYSPDKPFRVLCSGCFWGDGFDPLEYGRDFDFSRPFFEQFQELRLEVPRLSMYNTQSENSEFTAHSSRNRNCYMASSLMDCEDVLYSDWVMNSKDCIDCLFCTHLELCYECLDCHRCSFSDFLELCSVTSESFLAFDCHGCTRAIGCVSLRNREDHILNKPATRQECLDTVRKLKSDPRFFAEFEKQYEALKLTMPKRDAWIINSEWCSGNYITNSKNAHYAFSVDNIEDGRFVYESRNCRNVCDITQTNGEFLYECYGTVDLTYAMFCNLTYRCDNIAYSDNCENSSFCFGCVSMKGHEYCILNKKYPIAEYKALVQKIVDHMKKAGEWGEFFPVTMSPFGYNETKAQEEFPMERKDAEALGWHWFDYETSLPPDIKTLPASRLPDSIADIPDDILNWVIECEKTGKLFQIVPQELEFYRKKGLPVPRRAPLQRYEDRFHLRNPRRLYERLCEKCGQEIRTTYAPERPEKVYCEKCYLSEVY